MTCIIFILAMMTTRAIFLTILLVPLITSSPVPERELSIRDLLSNIASATASATSGGGSQLIPGLSGLSAIPGVGSAISAAKEAADSAISAVGAGPLGAASSAVASAGSAAGGADIFGVALPSPFAGLPSPFAGLKGLQDLLPKLPKAKDAVKCENPSLERLIKNFFRGPWSFFKNVHKDIDCFLQLYK